MRASRHLAQLSSALSTIRPSSTQHAFETVLKQAALRSLAADRMPDYPPRPSDSLALDVALHAVRCLDSAKMPASHEVISSLAQISTRHPHILSSLLLQDSPAPELYESLARYNRPGPDQLLLVINEMLENNFQPSSGLVQETIRALCEWAMPRLAIDLVRTVEASSPQGWRANANSWLEILIASAENYYGEGVATAWDHMDRTKGYQMDEGLLGRVLDVSAHEGLPALAERVLSTLTKNKIPVRESHLVAVIESHIKAGQVPEALRILTSIRLGGNAPTIETIRPIAAALSTPELIDQAHYSLEDMHKAGETVDLAALNALILASARLGDLRRVRATHAALPTFGLVADVDTFNLMLDGCIKARHRALGDVFLAEMAESGIQPQLSTYRRVVQLCLMTDEYDDAFFHLEKMKSEGMVPPESIYRDILQKCLQSDDKRWKLVQGEMEELGYKSSDAPKSAYSR